MPRREAEGCAVGEGARRAAAAGRSAGSPVPRRGAETAVHSGGQDAVAGVPRQGVRELARVATACEGDARGFFRSVRSIEKMPRGRAASIHGWVLREDEVVGDADEAVLLHLLSVIVLDFDTKEWKLPGWGPGLYRSSHRKGGNGTWAGIGSIQCLA